MRVLAAELRRALVHARDKGVDRAVERFAQNVARVIVSPGTMFAVLPSLESPSNADSVAVTESVSAILPSSMASNTSSATITFVSDAGKFS